MNELFSGIPWLNCYLFIQSEHMFVPTFVIYRTMSKETKHPVVLSFVDDTDLIFTDMTDKEHFTAKEAEERMQMLIL